MSRLSSEPGTNGSPTLTKISALKARIHELENQLEIAIADREKSEDEYEELIAEQARATPARSRAGRLVDVLPDDIVVHLRPIGRPYPAKKRRAAIERCLARRAETYRFEILTVERAGS
jgi:hypothetical protein